MRNKELSSLLRTSVLFRRKGCLRKNLPPDWSQDWPPDWPPGRSAYVHAGAVPDHPS